MLLETDQVESTGTVGSIQESKSRSNGWERKERTKNKPVRFRSLYIGVKTGFSRFSSSLSLSSLNLVREASFSLGFPVTFSDSHGFSGAADGGGASAPEFETSPIQKLFTFLNILFCILLESELRFFKRVLNRSRSKLGPWWNFFFKKTERKRRRTTAVTSLALRTHDCSGSWLGVVASASIAVASASIACVFRFCPLLLPLYRFDFPFFFSHRDRCLSSSLPVRNSHLVLRWNRFHDEDSYTNLWELMMNFG